MTDRMAAQKFNLFDLPEDYYVSPQRYFAMLREHDPVHENADGSVLLSRYADVSKVWMDLSSSVDKTEMFTEKFGPGPLLEHHTHTMLFRDPPDHDRLRKIVNPFFSKKNVDRMEKFVADLGDQLVENVRKKEEFDYVKDFAFKVPMTVIAHILGVPREDAERIHEIGMKILFPLNPNVSDEVVREGHEAVAEFKDYLLQHLEKRRALASLDPEADIISTLAQAQRDGSEISDLEILHMCILLLNGGHETTTNTLAVGLLSLVNDPESLAMMRDDPEVGRTGPDELIRFITPIQLQGRRLTKPLEIPSGPVLPEGTEIILCPASANRDPEKFDQPDRLNLHRKANRHYAFGGGVHLCIGRLLAKMEISTILPKFLNAFSHIEITRDPEFNRNARFRGLKELQVKVRE
ncbi:cytochrome P450 [Parasphingopyxis sp.]|uniref:cytochrome P450 n=1 Tax=Parasphingopyxis sp. TaxID=1920299 RepID=UPI002617DF0D|nr:cytochrome P450 [Parasphingopyxis sp.]